MLSESEILPYHFLLQYTSIFIDENGCWLTKRNINKNVYQRIVFNGKRVAAHVLSAILFCNHNKKLLACHSCDTPACFNPNHLFSGTNSDNQHDALKKNRLGSNRIKGQSKVPNQIEKVVIDICTLTFD